MKRIMILCVLALTAALFAETLPAEQFTKTKGFVWSDNALICDVPERPGKATWYRSGIWADLDKAKYAGKKVEFSAEVRWLAEPTIPPAKGLIQVIPIFENGREDYFGIDVKGVKSEQWQTVKFMAKIAPDTKRIRFFIGYQKQCGKFELRNLDFKVVGTASNPVQK